MNLVVLALIIWSILPFFFGWWGLSILNNKCKNDTLFTNLRTMIVTSAVVFIILTANLLCNSICHDDDEKTSVLVPVCTLALCIVIWSTGISINSNIKDCVDNSSQADAYKQGLTYACMIPTIAPFCYAVYVLYKRFKEYGKKKQQKAKIKHAKIAKKSAKEEAEKEAKALEAEKEAERQLDEQIAQKKKAEELRQQREKAQERRKQREKELRDVIDSPKKKAVERKLREKKEAEDKLRRATGKLTVDERVAEAKKKLFDEKVGKETKTITKLQADLEDEKEPSKIISLSTQLEKHQDNLKRLQEKGPEGISSAEDRRFGGRTGGFSSIWE